MDDQKVPYWQSSDWDGDGDVDADDAMVYLSRHLFIRLTDLSKNPLPNAKCRIIGDTETIFECDEKGVAHIPVPKGNPPGIDLEWEPKGATNQYQLKSSFHLHVDTKNDDACLTRLNNLGFYGSGQAEQVNAYQLYFDQMPTGILNDIRDEMVAWHDGGYYPGQVISVDQWASRLKEAFSGIGTDEDEVYSVLNEAQGKMGTLVASYPNLEDELYDEFSGDELKQALHLFYEVTMPPPSDTQIEDPQWVSRLFDAFNSGGILGGTDEDEIMSVLQAAKDANQMVALTTIYNQQHSDELTLDDELYDELSGDELRAALKLYYSGFEKNTQPQAILGPVIKINGTLAPADPSMPFTPQFPVPKEGQIWIRMCIPPEIIDHYSQTLHLFSTAGNYSQKKKVNEYKQADESSVYILFEGAPEGDDSKYTLELTSDDGTIEPLFKNAMYSNLQVNT